MTRQCPNCGKLLTYTRVSSCRAANSAGTLCVACGQLRETNPLRGRGRPESVRRKISESKMGHEATCATRQKLRQYRIGTKLTDSTKKKIAAASSGPRNPFYGKRHTSVSKQKMRTRRIADLKAKHHHVFANYNKRACQLFDEINSHMKWQGVHAENGGEHYIKQLGYWLDYYDPINNVVIEYDEKQHRKPKQKEKDIVRQAEICAFLGCRFFRIPEERQSEWKQIVQMYSL